MTDAKGQWTEYWSNESTTGEVFVNQQGEKHHALRQYWRHTLSNLTPDNRVIDLACGAGSIFADISEQTGCQLVAADLSYQAIQQLNQRMPEVETIVCSAAEVPAADGSFDIVVSQFGVEYAGMPGFKEALRLVAPGGKLRIIAHIENGVIDSRNQVELQGLELVSSTQFIDRAIAVTHETTSGNDSAARAAVTAFTEIEPQLSSFTEKFPFGFHAHLYQGFRQMFCNRERYEHKDILEWLKAMKGEHERSLQRLSDIRGATLSKKSIDELEQLIEGSKFQDIHISPFILPEYEQAVAWKIEANRP